MTWFIIFIAGLFEVGWAIGLKYTENFTKLTPTLLPLGSMAISVYLLGVAMHKLPVGTSYAVWTGIGTLGTVILGIVLFQEALTLPRLLCVGLILCGIIGLKFSAH